MNLNSILALLQHGETCSKDERSVASTIASWLRMAACYAVMARFIDRQVSLPYAVPNLSTTGPDDIQRSRTRAAGFHPTNHDE